MIRRRPSAAARFTKRLEPVEAPALTGREYHALRRIGFGQCGRAADRALLASRGLLTSSIGSRAVLTELGRAALTARMKESRDGR
jgi:hypothetical protein